MPHLCWAEFLMIFLLQPFSMMFLLAQLAPQNGKHEEPPASQASPLAFAARIGAWESIRFCGEQIGASDSQKHLGEEILVQLLAYQFVWSIDGFCFSPQIKKTNQNHSTTIKRIKKKEKKHCEPKRLFIIARIYNCNWRACKGVPFADRFFAIFW